jgi:HAE1 family hydrophobic/amphiphilic exporter-1
MPHFFIRRPIVAMVISILMVIAGAVALETLPIEQYPSLAPPVVRVQGTYTGANAEVVEQSVATPIEQQVNGVDDLIYMKSLNSSDGRMVLDVTFRVGADRDTSNMLVQNRVSQAQARLPQEVLQQGLTVKKINPSILLVASIYSPNGAFDALFLNNYAMLNVRDPLLRVPGVAQVDLFGGSEYGMRVWLRPDDLASLRLTPADVIAAIREQNLQAPAGQIGAAPSAPGQQFTYTVRAPQRLVTAEEFGDIIVRSTAEGREVRLRDIGRVELGAENYKSFGRLDGKPAGVLAVYLLPGANQLEAAEGIYRTLDELKQLFPPDVDYRIVYDTTPAVVASIDEINRTLLEAIALVVIVVFVFLQNLRATVIPLLTVPVSLLGTFIFFPFLGFTVNTLTMFGLVLAIGIVVDDAIVVVEAVMHNLEHGMDARTATEKAMTEVSGPIVGIGLVLTAVFVPVAFLGGLTGRLYQQFALTIAIAVIISVFTALSLSPALSALLLRPPKPARGPLGGFFRGFNRAFDVSTNGYVRGAGLLARKSILSVALLALVVWLSSSLAAAVPGGFVPDEDQGIVMANVQLPNGASLERTDAVLRQVETIFAGTPGVESFNTVGGLAILTNTYQSNVGSFFVRLKPWEERTTPEESLRGIIAHLRREMSKLPEAIAFPFFPPSIPGFGAAGGFSFVLQDRSGTLSVDDMGVEASRFLAAARQRPELTSLFTAFDPASPQYAIDLDRESARKLGVPMDDVFQALSASMGGAFVNDFNRFGRLYRVYIQAEAEYRQRPEDINRIYVRSTRTGTMVPLSSLVTIAPAAGTELTVRFNLMRSVELSGQAAPGYSSAQAMAALEQVAAEVLSPEMGYSYSGLSYEERNAPSPVPTFVMAVVFVFLLLAAVYESWSLPWAVLLGTPIVILGAFFGVWVMGLQANVYVQIGLVMLIGLAAKNAILIVEFAKMERERGKSAVDAALEAARLRFRPILMTALAFIMGVVPLMLATGSGAASRAVMGTAVFFGMLVATIIGVFLYPALFVLVDTVAQGRMWRAPAPAVTVARVIAFIVLTFSGCACMLGPNYTRPTVTPPPMYRGAIEADRAASIADVRWVEQYRDPDLAALIQTGIAENLDLRLAVARISEFRARAAAARADLGPTLFGTFGGQARSRIDEDDSWLRSIYSLGVAFNWEIDFFGRLRRASEAARNDLLATEDAARAVMSSIVSDIAQTWFELRVTDELLEITERNIKLQEDALLLVQRRVQGGVAGGLDEQQAVSQLASTRAERPFLEQQAQLAENRLSVLVGRAPAAIQRPAPPVAAVPPDVPVGLPSELLERRPDIRQAERELMAATSRIGVAMGNAFPFPRIGLTAFFGMLSASLDQLFKGDESGVVSWSPFVDYPLIDSGRGRAGIAVAAAQAEQAAVFYRSTILLALREVADTLVARQKVRERVEQQEVQVAAAREAVRLSDARYVGGVADYLEVLDSQRVLFLAEVDLARSRLDELIAAVQLYRALGGGWSDDELRRLMDTPAEARK